jgi:hypothetical protein
LTQYAGKIHRFKTQKNPPIRIGFTERLPSLRLTSQMLYNPLPTKIHMKSILNPPSRLHDHNLKVRSVFPTGLSPAGNSAPFRRKSAAWMVALIQCVTAASSHAVDFVWNNSAATGLWNTTDANWTGST